MNIADQQAHDFRLMSTIEDYVSHNIDKRNICNELKERLHKLHFYEWVFFNGRDSDDAKRLKPCINDEREFIALDLEECI